MKNELSTGKTAKGIFPKRKVENTYTTRELAEQLNTSPKVILENAKKCLPDKKIENGKPTFWTQPEITVLIECLKGNNPNQNTFTGAVKAVTTDLTPALMIKQAMELAQKGYELELARIAAEKESLQVQLDRSKEWYSIKRMEKLNKGQHFDWRVLKNESKKMGVEVKEVFDANYGKVNAYHQSVWESLYFDTLDYGN